jgi:phenylacetate-CoA ligase
MTFSKNESFSKDELEDWQLSHLKETLIRVFHLVPFYKKRFEEMGVRPEDIKTLADISKLPFTTKKNLRDNYPFGMFSVEMDQIVRVHSSSGTTGKPTVVGYT